MGVQVTLCSLAAGLSTFTLALYFYSTYMEYVAERLAYLRDEGGEATSLSFRVVKPFARFFGRIIGALMVSVRERFGEGGLSGYLTALRVRIQRALVAAGRPEGLTADEYIGLSFFSALIWTLVGAAVWALLGSSFAILLGLMIGVMHPLLWLRKRLNHRRNEIRKLLPYAIDLLTLSVEAGLDFTAAMARMVPKLAGTALSVEFGELLRQIRLGRSRAEALRDFADRVDMPEIVSFTSSLIQAEELGAGISGVLRTQAEQMRNDRSNRAEKKAMEAPVKILFPLIAFIFPTVFIIIFAPMAMSYLAHFFGP